MSYLRDGLGADVWLAVLEEDGKYFEQAMPRGLFETAEQVYKYHNAAGLEVWRSGVEDGKVVGWERML